jgi:two-component system chemotaxis response regulator CheY
LPTGMGRTGLGVWSKDEEVLEMGRKILAVDDSSSIRKMVEFSLKSKGFQVTTAADGQEALELLAKDKPDAIILDINMPRLDGFGVLKKIRADKAYASIPVMMLTTEGQDEDMETALSLGANHYIVKPFKPSELIAAIEKLVQ